MNSDIISVARAFVAAINRHSVDEIGELMSKDHKFIDSWGRTQSGRKTMVAAWKQYLLLFPDWEIRVESILAGDGIVAIFGQASGTYKGKRGLVPENRIVMPAAWKVLVKHGKVKRWQVYCDWTEGMKIIERDRNG